MTGDKPKTLLEELQKEGFEKMMGIKAPKSMGHNFGTQRRKALEDAARQANKKNKKKR